VRWGGYVAGERIGLVQSKQVPWSTFRWLTARTRIGWSYVSSLKRSGAASTATLSTT